MHPKWMRLKLNSVVSTCIHALMCTHVYMLCVYTRSTCPFLLHGCRLFIVCEELRASGVCEVFHYCYVIIIHAICPGGTEKSRNFDPSKPVPAGRHFSRNPCGLSNALHFQTCQIAIKTIITRSSNPSHVYCIYLTPVQRCGKVFRQ